MNPLWRINIMLEGDGSHLPAPSMECPRSVKVPIPVVPPDIQMIIISTLVSNSHITIVIHISRIHMFTFKCSIHYTNIE